MGSTEIRLFEPWCDMLITFWLQVLVGGVLIVSFSVRCEQLLGVNGKLRQELMLIGEPIPELQERLRQLLQVLIQRYKHKGSKQPRSHRSSSRKDV